MHVRIDPACANPPTLNILQPILSSVSMTGGPNTIVTMAFHVAREGVPVRIVTTRGATDSGWFRRHLLAVTGAAEYPPSLSVAFAGDASAPLAIGVRDIFLATHWTTAQQIKPLLPKMDVQRFFYLIQDFEPGFHAWSSNYALALETYDLDFIPVINERFLFDFLCDQSIGRFTDPRFAERALVFEPAIDARVFHPGPRENHNSPRTLLVYARPTNPRNLLGIGVAALRQAIADGTFGGEPWNFLAIGARGSLPELDLGGGHTLRPAPWKDYDGYAQQLRDADILLCPMLSPHTSYPVLEMAACGGLAVTNTFGTKTVDRLTAISDRIVASKPTIEGFAEALTRTVHRLRAGAVGDDPPNLPTDWDAALAPVTAEIVHRFREITSAHGHV